MVKYMGFLWFRLHSNDFFFFGIYVSGPTEIKAGTGNKLSGGAISGVVIGSLIVLIAFIMGVLYFRRYHKKRVQYRHSLMVDMDEL